MCVAWRRRGAQGTLLPALVALLLVPELEEQVLRVFTLLAEAIDLHAQVLQLCLLLGLGLRALFLCSMAFLYSELCLMLAQSSKSFSKPSAFKNEG